MVHRSYGSQEPETKRYPNRVHERYIPQSLGWQWGVFESHTLWVLKFRLLYPAQNIQGLDPSTQTIHVLRLLLPDPPRLPLLHPCPLLLRGRLNGYLLNTAHGLSALGICLPRLAPTYFAVVVLRQNLYYVALADLGLAT